MLFTANDRSERKQWVTTADSNNQSNQAGSESDTSDTESFKGLRKTPLAILDADLKSSGIRFSPMRFAPQEKILLRDNMSSVNRKDIQPKFNRLSHDHIKLGAYLGAAVRLVYKDHAYKIKRISYDRPLLHNGLLYFIDALERNGKGSFHIWLLLRLVVIGDDSAKIENPEPVMTINKKTKKEEPWPLCVVHDMYCKECRHRKPCDHKFKACQRITDYTFGLYIKFPVKLEGNLYLYAITLNSPMQAALSSRVFLSSTAKKQAERAKKEKEREEKKEKYSDMSDGGSGFDHSSDSSSAQSFSEVPTEQTGAVDLAQDYMDEDSFFERSYMSFRKAEPSQKERKQGGMLDRGSDAGETGTDDYMSTEEGIDDPDDEYDVPDDDDAYEDLGESSGGGAIGVLAQLRNQGFHFFLSHSFSFFLHFFFLSFFLSFFILHSSFFIIHYSLFIIHYSFFILHSIFSFFHSF